MRVYVIENTALTDFHLSSCLAVSKEPPSPRRISEKYCHAAATRFPGSIPVKRGELGPAEVCRQVG